MKKILLSVVLFFVVASAAAGASFKDSLLELDGVVSVEEIIQSGDYEHFAEKYIVKFVQPLDWDGASQEVFTQRVDIGFSGWDNVNVVNVGGYMLHDEDFSDDDRHELAKMYNGNYINVEYRFFGESVPAGLDRKGMSLWEYLTDENASNDFHNIMEQLKEILSGTWVFTGTSKGGQATNVFAYYFPEDADAYVPYVAPFCDGADDGRAYEAVFNTIGNERYGREQAQAYRDLMLSFLVEVIRNRDYLQPLFVTPDDLDLYSRISADVIFESKVIEFAESVWQYSQDFASIEEIMRLSRDGEHQKFLDGIVKLVSEDMTDETPYFPYYVQAAKENGNYGFRLGSLREALAKEGLSLAMSEELEHEFYSYCFTDEQKAAFRFDPTLRNNMLDWTNTNTSNVIMIYGDSDPWYFVRLPETDNPNIHIFTSSKAAHLVRILSMEEEYRTRITELLNSWLMHDADHRLASSSGGCDSLSSGIALLVLALLVRRRDPRR